MHDNELLQKLICIFLQTQGYNALTRMGITYIRKMTLTYFAGYDKFVL